METIDVKYEKKEIEELISSEDLIKEYIKIYSQIKQKYINYFKKGTGKKTNDYYQPSMNYAYNYIEHDDFKKEVYEPIKGWDSSNRPKSEPIKYTYYLSLWSIVCNEISRLHDNKFKIKFDHRYKDRKNNDFDGTIICFNNSSFWKNHNLPNKQRYK